MWSFKQKALLQFIRLIIGFSGHHHCQICPTIEELGNSLFCCRYCKMSAAIYKTRDEEKQAAPIHISQSFDRDVEDEDVTEDRQDTPAEYLEKTLGKVLGDVLAECAQKRPDDPINFVSKGLER